MEEKIKKRSLIVLVIAVFIGIFVFVLNTSYGFFTTEVNSKNYVAYAGTLKVDFTKDSDVLNITDATPMTNAEGLASSNNSYSFKVTNTGTIDAKYQVRLEVAKENNEEYIPLEYIKLAYSTDGTNYSDPVKLSDLENNLVFIEPTQLAVSAVDSYTIKLWLDYSAPNEVVGKTFKVQVVVDAVQELDSDHMDSDAKPIIVLNKNSRGNLDERITVGSTYTDPGVLSVTDDRDILDKDDIVKTYKYFNGETITTVSSVNTSNAGVYYIEYSITDNGSNVGKAERIVVVNPTPTTPTITLIGDNPMEINQRSDFDDPGVTVATGNRVVTLGEVKTSAPGSYTVRYVVIDKDGNMNSVTRTVNVIENICSYETNQQFTFEYTGEVQTFEPECEGQYKLEVWGAQGGTNSSYPTDVGGYGGYATGIYETTSSDPLYIVVGSQGSSSTTTGATNGGYNGGGKGYTYETSYQSAGGGGATHIGLKTGLLSTFASDYSTNLLLTAGGGGGSAYAGSASNQGITGSGGGYTGASGKSYTGTYTITGGTQSAGGNGPNSGATGTFGQGANATSSSSNTGAGGGGGGFYGGGANSTGMNGSYGGGGSGYINTTKLTSAEMYMYTTGCNASTSTATKTTCTSNSSTTPTTNYAKQGNGYAKITYLGNPNQPPTITVTVSGAKATFNITSYKQIYGYGVSTSSSEEPTYTVLNQMNPTATYRATTTGTYYVWVKDVDGRRSKKAFTIEDVTNTCTYEEGQQFTFDYTGNVQTFEPECEGTYKLEVWGAQGGNASSDSYTWYGGKGGYSSGTISVTSSKKLYIYVGGSGATRTATNTSLNGGFNGGGNSPTNTNYTVGGSGGGASDIRVEQDSLYARVIVAGGGGGAGYGTTTTNTISGGTGGGTSGTKGVPYSGYESRLGNPGTNSGSGSGGTGGSTDNGVAGTFGQGGQGGTGASAGAGGGGGWYGGGGGASGNGCAGGGGGGSGYVYTSSTASNYPSGCLLNSSYYLTNAQTIAGNQSFTSPTGTNETGHSGNGYARITYLGE